MAEYSPRNFMRQVSNSLLREYFAKRGLALDVSWDTLKETQVEPLWEAWQRLEPGEQHKAEAEFNDVNRLANEGGVGVLIQEGEWHNLDLAAAFAELDDHVDKAMWTFLHQPAVFDVAVLFQAADSIASQRWHKWINLPPRPPADDAAACEQLGRLLSEYFLLKQGRGRHCKVEVYQRAGNYYYFAFPEDYARAEQDFDERGELNRRTHRPAFQVVFVYNPVAGTLDASAPGGKLVVDALMRMAVECLQGISHKAGPKDERVYALERLVDAQLAWDYPVTAGIARVWVKSLRLTFKASKQRLTLEGPEPGTVHSLYARLTKTNGARPTIVADSVYVTQAVLRVEYAPRNNRKLNSRDIRLTYPNTCNLGQDDRDRALREMLIASGIDPEAIGRDAER